MCVSLVEHLQMCDADEKGGLGGIRKVTQSPLPFSMLPLSVLSGDLFL